MRRNESFLEALDKIAASHQPHLTNDEWVKERLRWEDWRVLGQEPARFAVASRSPPRFITPVPPELGGGGR
jgi:hypothetical protein